ncbi:hypothetical protein FRZ67_14980 [Panacibacter ginsenosidivorans]|uniref:tRNA_anti-like n=1 Tax=Panacibacter ginsenosidivorans TaxID=1813871 RepID=A0A5B8VBZ0_9BACT|nr:hypothetical protein [Panacibacter ginsenosidivorans]QEC68545.1 hypothetical protein FRZ67_14980 [Panacibacter ginsenosidivorans]
MLKGRKRILIIFITLILAGVSYGLYVWNKPHRDVKDEKGVIISAAAIFDSFTVNETRANELYLNKAIQVTGEVSGMKKNQDGQAVVYLKTSDPVFGVNCTFKEDPGPLETGTIVTFKGICTGYLSDVIINQGIIIK